MPKTYGNIKAYFFDCREFTFASNTNSFREVKNVPPNFKRIASRCFTT